MKVASDRAGERADAACVAELSQVRKAFGRLTVLAGLDLAVRRGEIVALLGANGAGKTTGLRTLLGIIPPDAGVARLFGTSPRDAAARARVGWQPQQPALYHLIRVEEALDLFGSYYERRASTPALLDAFGLARRRQTEFRKLSGGERQRLALALAFVNAPQLVVLDEPTMALDVAGRMAVWAMLRRFRDDGGAVLLATHLLEEAEELADRVAILHDGVVAATGSPQQLIATHVGNERVVFRPVSNGHSAAALLAELRDRFTVEEEDGGAVALSGAPQHDLMVAVFEVSRRHEVALSEIRERKGSLERVFLRVTGTAISC